MKHLIHSLNQYFANVPAQLRNHKKKLFAFYLLLIIAIGYGAQFIKLDMTIESFFQPDDPSLMTMNRFKSVFTSDDGVYLVYKAKDGNVLSNESLRALKSVHDEMQNLSLEAYHPLNHITRITSLINANYLEVDGDTLISRDFIGEDLPLSNDILETRKKEGLAHPDFPGIYFSKDFEYAALMIETDFGGELAGEEVEPNGRDEFDLNTNAETVKDAGPPKFKPIDMQEYGEFWHPIQAILDKPEIAKQLDFYPAGTAVLMSFFLDIVIPEMVPIFGGTLLLIAIMLWILFRSFSAVFWPLVIVIASIIITMGFIGWSALSMNMMIQVVQLLLLVVGIADSVHILSGYLFNRREGLNHEEAMAKTYSKSGTACLLTSITTGVGLVSLILVPIKPIQNFGIASSLGVLVAFLLTIYLLPLLMDLWHPAKKLDQGTKIHSKNEKVQHGLTALMNLGKNNSVAVIVVFVTIFCIFLYGFFQVQVNSNMLEIVPEKYKIRQAYNIVDEKLGGTANMEVFVEFNQIDALKDPGVLKTIELFQHWLEQAYPDRVKDTSSLVDVVKQTNRTLNQNRLEMYKIPQDRGMLAQTLLMFDNSSRDDRLRFAPDDYGSARISIRMLNGGSVDFVEITDDINRKLEELFAPLKMTYPDMQINATGTVSLMMNMVDHISWSQIKSFSIALLVISLILLVVFGSFSIGLVAILPNIFPVITTFGVMGFMGVRLDLDTLIVAPIVIGIAVDDTIHFLTHYKEEYLKHGDVETAIRKATEEVGQAILFTSLILATGFLLMIRFSHLGLAYFGGLSAIAIMSALMADLLLLPAFLRIFNVTFKRGLEER